MSSRWFTVLLSAFAVAQVLASPLSTATAGELSCSAESSLRSRNSNHPMTITFVNSSGAYRALVWIDFQGNKKDYGGMNSGGRKTINTFLTHPWMITDGPGNCIYVFTPGGNSGTVQLH